MTTPEIHNVRERRQVQAIRWSSGHLLNQRARLRVLIYAMEHDQNVQAQPWQVLSLKKMLEDIEYRIGHQVARPPRARGRRACDHRESYS